MTPTTAPGVAARARLPTWRIAVECSRCGLLLPRGGGGTSIGSSQTGGRYALHEDLGRLSHRHALAPARSLHRERLGAHEGPHALRRGRARRTAVDDQEGGAVRARRRHRVDGHEVRARAKPSGGRDGVDRALRRRQEGDPPPRRSAPARQGHGPGRRPGRGALRYPRGRDWDMEPMWHPMWEPLWQAVNDVDLPLHFHTFPSLPPGVRERQTGLTRRAAFFTSVAGFQMNLVNILAAVIGAAVLERYPNLRISFGESGIGWIPYALDRMDFEWEDRFRDLGLTMKPSDDMGVETIMWASDYPHTDGVWPESSKYIAEQFGHLPPDVVHKITCENAGKFYGLMT